MKKILLLIYMMFPVLVMAQGHKGEVDECAPMKNGKVCYSDDVEIENTSKLEIFNAINAWAKKSYGKDVFLSNVNSNKNKGTIFVSSKVELLLNDTDKTIIKYKMEEYNNLIEPELYSRLINAIVSKGIYRYRLFSTLKNEPLSPNNKITVWKGICPRPKALFCN